MSHYCRWEKTLLPTVERCVNRHHPRGTPSTRDVPPQVYVAPDRLPPTSVGALEAKDAGMALALEGPADLAEYGKRFSAAFDAVVKRGGTFTSENITEKVGLPLNLDGSVNNGRVGALMGASVSRWKDCVRRSGFKPGRRVSAHARMISVWESDQ